MESFATLPALEDLLLDACAVPLSADEESSLDAMLSSSQSSCTVPSDAERHGSGNMTYFCVVS
ncbi:lipopeptide mating pheromone precursor Bap3(3) [Schizophyllum commune]